MFLIQLRIGTVPYASNIFFYLRKCTLDYDMQCNSVLKLSQKPRVILTFELEHFKPIFVRRKLRYHMYLRICGSFKSEKIIMSANPKSANHIWPAYRKSANCHICGRSANLYEKSANLRICDWRNLFAEYPPLLKCVIKKYLQKEKDPSIKTTTKNDR